ncbi:MAG: hypothetical protein JXM70_27315 [Pirellulales bacterium]|nr:hypothetical protein [Pirellulales bacterium]
MNTKPPFPPTSVIIIVGILCTIVIQGCGGTDRLSTAKVSGLVTLDGKPLSKGTVVFTPAAGRAATGKIQPDGTFVLGTYATSDGAVLGKHQVAVVARETKSRQGGDPAAPPITGPSLIPERYSNSATSGLTFEVTDDGKNEFNIQLSSKRTF